MRSYVNAALPTRLSTCPAEIALNVYVPPAEIVVIALCSVLFGASTNAVAVPLFTVMVVPATQLCGR